MVIDKFDGQYAFLSNFYESPITDGTSMFPTVEHYFQAAKTDTMQDYLAIARAKTPGESKRLGRKVHLRSDWEQVKDQVMLDALRKKFAIPELREKLLATGDADLIEGTVWHDQYWGICNCDRCKGKGINILGKLLIQVREEIKKEAQASFFDFY